MTKIKNIFAKGTIDKDSDERMTSPEVMIDAENFIVTTSEGNNGGVGKNVPGNLKKTSYGINGARTIGRGKNESKEKLYNFIKGTDSDYIIEYDVTTNTSVVVLQSSTNGVLNFKTGERIVNVDVISSGKDNDDLLAWSGDSNPPRIVNIERAKTFGVDGFTDDEISVMKPSPIFAPTINLTTSVDGVNNNFIKDKFICFAYRYKYVDGFYSAPSSWSRIAFEPNRFRLDYQTVENNGMLNISNAVDVGFKVGPREVKEVELLFRESNSQTVFVIESFNKQKESWSDDSNQMFQFSKSKIFKILSEDQFYRNFDNVPLSSKAQAIIGNRLAYANYIEGYDIDTNIDFNVELVSTEPYLKTIDSTIESFTDIVDYSNIVDFEKGVLDGGSAPVDQMNFTTNEIEVVLGAANRARFTLNIKPKSQYSIVKYSIYIKQGATTLSSLINVSGKNTLSYDRGSDGNVAIYVVSDFGLIYDSNLSYRLTTGSDPVLTKISKYNYYAYHQLSFPKSTGYGSSLDGDKIISSVININMNGFDFEAGNQIRLDIESSSSLVQETPFFVTFFYNLTSNYIDLDDFIVNSSFKEILENAFSLEFKNTKISNEGMLVSYEGFKLSYIGDVITIRTPKVVYLVTEDSGISENKNEFFIVKSSSLYSVENSSFTSLHSNRDVEVCMFYLDSKGRKTTSLVSKENTVFIPASNSVNVNKLKVKLNHTPPSFAKYYKFGVKQIKKEYEIFYGNQIYKDGIYRWIRLIGENKNKIKEGDLLTVKSDYSGPLEYLVKAKVLEIADKQKDFIPGNLLSTGNDLIEGSGLYMKIKQGNFNMNIDVSTFKIYEGFKSQRYMIGDKVYTAPLFGEFSDDATPVFIPTKIKAGSEIRFFVRMYMFKNGAFDQQVEIKVFAQEDYASVKDWWDAEISTLQSWLSFADDRLQSFGWDISDTFGTRFYVASNRDGTQRSDVRLNVVFDINFSGGTLVFETEPFENLSTSFFETPETFTINNGLHQSNVHILQDAFDCFTFGNGVESFKIQDSFIGKSFSIDSNANNVDQEGYKRINRFADITYSGVFNSNTSVNKLNEFNLSLANYKDDIEKIYGPIIKIKGQDTNLDVYQEDKCSIVYYGKDVLYNADGTSNLSRIEDVLGQQKTNGGEFGISEHPESFDDFGFNSYFTDVKRGVVLKNNFSNGIFEVSSQFMRSYFKKLFRNNKINQVIGQYDQYNDFYLLNIQYNDTEYVTWVYSDKNDGWLGRLKFSPESMIRINNHLVSFKNGEVYLHNQEDVRNTFYGIESPSKFSFYFSQEPSIRKKFKNIEIEGSTKVNVKLKTDLNSGYINNVDFEKKEGVFYAYVRSSNDVEDTALLSFQGIGNCNINGLVLEFNFELDSIISVGDQIRNSNLELVGTITSKTSKSLTLNSVSNISNGDYVLVSKPQSISNNDLLGYYMRVDCEFQSNEYQEIFAINSEVSKSFS